MRRRPCHPQCVLSLQVGGICAEVLHGSVACDGPVRALNSYGALCHCVTDQVLPAPESIGADIAKPLTMPSPRRCDAVVSLTGNVLPRSAYRA